MGLHCLPGEVCAFPELGVDCHQGCCRGYREIQKRNQ